MPVQTTSRTQNNIFGDPSVIRASHQKFLSALFIKNTVLRVYSNLKKKQLRPELQVQSNYIGTKVIDLKFAKKDIITSYHQQYQTLLTPFAVTIISK